MFKKLFESLFYIKETITEGKGGLRDRLDRRDKVFIAPGINYDDWRKGYDVYKELGLDPDKMSKLDLVKNQGSSLSCGGQAQAYYGELLNYFEVGKVPGGGYDPRKYKVFSAKGIYSQTRLEGGGSYVRDNMKKAVKWGYNKEKTVPSYIEGEKKYGANEEVFKDLSWKNEVTKKEAEIFASKEYRAISSRNLIDVVAEAIKANKGCVIGYTGSNQGSKYAVIRVPKKGEKRWGHLVYCYGYEIKDGKKAIKFINSWGNGWGNKGHGWINEDYFAKQSGIFGRYLVFAPWTLTDKPNKLINENMKLQLVQNTKLPSPYDKDVFAVEESDNGVKILHKIVNAESFNFLQRVGWITGWDKINQIKDFKGYQFGNDILISKSD